MNSPFKFLDSFTKEDKDTFFGRDNEIEKLYSSVFETNLLLVYGVSGTGKSSLIQCGLANKFEDSDWLPISVRRGLDINQSLSEAIAKAALTPLKDSTKLAKSLKSLYLDHFKPIYLIFDQFEELFIFGTDDEKQAFVNQVAAIIEADLQCRFIFVIREEYLASLTEFEPILPSLFSNRIRIEKMTRSAAAATITGPCAVHGIHVEEGFAPRLLEKLSPDKAEIELTYLQVFLDKLYRMAVKENAEKPTFTLQMLEELGRVGDILSDFLEEQIGELEDSEIGLSILKAFVSLEGTKKQIGRNEIAEFTTALGKSISPEQIDKYVNQFVDLRILRDKDENGKYELRHDSLASKIYQKITLVEKELLEIREFMVSSYTEFEKRGVYLREDDLSYIAPYEDKLFLTKKFESFIQESRNELQRVKKRKRSIAVAAAVLLLIMMSGFTFWALNERAEALRQSELVADLQKQLDAGSFLSNQVKTIVIPQSTYIIKGDTFKADIFLAASDSLTQPEIFVTHYDKNGKPVVAEGDDGTFKEHFDQVEVINGVGKAAIPTEYVGQHDWGGVIRQKTTSGTNEYPFQSSYQVAEPGINVSADKMNVMYIGVENSITVSVSGFSFDKVRPFLYESDGKIFPDSGRPGGYIVTSTKPGLLKLAIEAEVMPETYKQMGYKTFRVKRTPLPVVSFMMIEGEGNISVDALSKAKGLMCKMINFDFEIAFKVVSFDLSVDVGSGVRQNLHSESNILTPRMKEYLAKARVGQKILITNVRAKSPNTPIEKIPGITLTVIDKS